MDFSIDIFIPPTAVLPYFCYPPLDLKIETTINLKAKLKQGWLHVLWNDKQLFSKENVAQVKAILNPNLEC